MESCSKDERQSLSAVYYSRSLYIIIRDINYFFLFVCENSRRNSL
jgi:hypothetical protein